MPKPEHNRDDEWEENRLERNPNFGEAAVLVDDGKMQVHDVADVEVHLLLGIDGDAHVEEVKVVVQRAHFEDWNRVALVKIFVGVVVGVAAQVALLQRAGVELPLVLRVFLVAVSESHVERDFRVRLVVDFGIVGDVGLQDSNQVLLPSRVVQVLAFPRQRHLEHKNELVGHPETVLKNLRVIQSFAWLRAA